MSPFAHKTTGGRNVPSDDEIRKICDDPSLSYWLKNALRTALERDPVDAANDAGLLALVLDKRAADISAAALLEAVRRNAGTGPGTRA